MWETGSFVPIFLDVRELKAASEWFAMMTVTIIIAWFISIIQLK
jgi:hypothetical protein